MHAVTDRQKPQAIPQQAPTIQQLDTSPNVPDFHGFSTVDVPMVSRDATKD